MSDASMFPGIWFPYTEAKNLIGYSALWSLSRDGKLEAKIEGGKSFVRRVAAK